MSTEKDKKIHLWECIQSYSEITCNKCGKTESYGGDADECIDAIFEDGWYATKNQNVYCKSCNEKRTKVKP